MKGNRKRGGGFAKAKKNRDNPDGRDQEENKNTSNPDAENAASDIILS